MTKFRDDKTSGILFLEISTIKINKKERVKGFNQRFITLLNIIHIKPAEEVHIEYYTSALPPNIAMFVKNQEN